MELVLLRCVELVRLSWADALSESLGDSSQDLLKEGDSAIAMRGLVANFIACLRSELSTTLAFVGLFSSP